MTKRLAALTLRHMTLNKPKIEAERGAISLTPWLQPGDQGSAKTLPEPFPTVSHIP
jgi:hypothetical protein